MITLNEIAYNIKNLAYGGMTSLENSISLKQIKHWIHYHRAKLISDNLNKGITNNQAFYQNMALTARDSATSYIRDFYATWAAHDIDSNVTPPTLSNEYLLNAPKTSGGDRLNGEWLAFSSLSADSNGSSQSWMDLNGRSFYGEEIVSLQERGDFRNVGHHSFIIPKPLQLKNDEGIKSVSIERYVHFPDDPVTTETNEQSGSYAKKSIRLYRRNNDAFDNHNKFTNTTKPSYIHSTLRLHREEFAGYNFLSLRGLQVTPNYHGGLTAPGNQKVFFKYRGAIAMILQDPTQAEQMSYWWWEEKEKWDDDKTPYPIAMEYVNDLIQRVLQIEVKTALTTNPDIIVDGQDDNKKQPSGPQVQR